MYYQIIKAGKEEIGLVWDDAGKKPQVENIYLPHAKHHVADRIAEDYPEAGKSPCPIPGGIDRLIAGLYQGKKLTFDLSILNWSRLSGFSVHVLKQTYKIPRGKVATYSGLAKKSGAPRAARAVGTVMANNPFPIVIPCHRVVRADGSTGQFGGGGEMKKQLLEKEGVIFNINGTISSKCVWC